MYLGTPLLGFEEDHRFRTGGLLYLTYLEEAYTINQLKHTPQLFVHGIGKHYFQERRWWLQCTNRSFRWTSVTVGYRLGSVPSLQLIVFAF